MELPEGLSTLKNKEDTISYVNQTRKNQERKNGRKKASKQ